MSETKSVPQDFLVALLYEVYNYNSLAVLHVYHADYARHHPPGGADRPQLQNLFGHQS